MNRVLIAVLAIMLLCSSSLGQSPQSPGSGSTPPDREGSSAGRPSPSSTPAQATAATAPAASASRIPAGSVIPVELLKTIDAKKAKSGDEVTARVTQDMRNRAGNLVVSKDTKILGHVTEAQARSKQQKESHLTIVFDHAVLKNGEQIQTAMSIQAIVAPPNRNFSSQAANVDAPTYGSAQGTSGASANAGAMASPAGQAPGIPQRPGTETAAVGQPQPPITGETKGVVGIPDLKLSAAPDPAQGSLVSSEKNNVKLDGGTFLLLRVNQ
jgi:hypothetical protein